MEESNNKNIERLKNEETNAPTAYGKYVDECLNEAAKHFFSEGEDKYSVAELFYAGVRCGKSWLEKQREQKPYGQRKKCSDCQFNYAGECKGSCQMKRDEQKTADKVEPKFHEGDWIVFNGLTLLVNEVVQGYYRTVSIGGTYNSYDWDIDNVARLWTIADAKDGDILSNGKMIVIFKHFEEPSYKQHIVAYIGLDISGNIQITDDTWSLGIDKAKPATKEQRDFLFEKMKEAGYEWDSDIKKLKKIETVGIPFSAKDSELMEATYFIPEGFHAEIVDNKVIIRKGKQRPTEKVGYNIFWSKEDEERTKNILGVLDVQVCWDGATLKKMNPYQKEINWLQSLKNRIVPQQKEWSEDDEQIALSIGQVMNCAALLNIVPEKISRIRTWLQSLKQRVIWKPTVNEKSNTELAEPTPITPKILQKNGFELKPNGWLWCQDKGNEEQNYIFIQFRKDLDEVRLAEISFVGKIQGTFQQVQDVHELQNLLNVCSIKKEIEL